MKNNMEKIINNYIKYLQEIKNLSPKSIKSYIPVVEEMIKDCNFKTVEDIQNSNVVILQNWLNKKKNEGLSDQSINRRVASCKSFYNYLYAFRLIDFNASKELKAIRIESKGKTGDTGQVDKIRTYLENEYNRKPNYMNMRNRLIVEIMLNSALRNSVLRLFNIDSINPNTG